MQRLNSPAPFSILGLSLSADCVLVVVSIFSSFDSSGVLKQFSSSVGSLCSREIRDESIPKQRREIMYNVMKIPLLLYKKKCINYSQNISMNNFYAKIILV